MQEIEKMELLFEDIKKGRYAACDELLEIIWPNVSVLPHTGATVLLTQIYDWAKNHPASPLGFFARINLAIGAVAFHSDEFDDAMKYSLAARDLFSGMNDRDGIAICANYIGSIYRSWGEIDMALKYGLESIEQLSVSGKYQVFQLIAMYWVGSVYADTGQYDQALAFFRRGLTIEDELGKVFMRARLTSGIAGVYMKQEKYGLALENYQKALEMGKSSGEGTFRARGLTDLADYSYKMGDYQQAIRYNEEALAIRQELKIQNGAITNMMNLGSIFRQQGKPGEAVAMLEHALKLAEEIRVKAKMYQIHQQLSDIYLGIGNMPAGLAHYKAFHEIKEDVNHEDMERKVKYQQRLFEAEQTQKENAIIKAQKAEIERKNHQLEETIEELTITKVSRRAKAITLFIGVTLFVTEGMIFHFVLNPYVHDNFLITIVAEGAIVLLIKPIEKAVEHYLLAQVLQRKRALAAVG